MSRYSRRPLAGFAALAPCAALIASVASVAFVALVALSACSSPPSRFYTLAGGLASSEVRSAAPPLLMIDVAAVDVPAQVARSALVVQTSATRVDVLEQARWASLPADEIRLALSQELAQRLDAIDVSRSPRPAGVSVYRVKLSV
ncbi:MAG: membrane integrity-associated transporter subunit PqiC, partial [Burkholderia sp.]|nr:membrane integrity-associated transporter subunit PqiC [Burkholderia sp.]